MAITPAAGCVGVLGARVIARVGTRTTLVAGGGVQGLATGLATMTQQVGITLGIPVMSAVVTARAGAASAAAPHAVLGGISLAVLVNAGLVAAGAAASGVFLRARKG